MNAGISVVGVGWDVAGEVEIKRRFLEDLTWDALLGYVCARFPSVLGGPDCCHDNTVSFTLRSKYSKDDVKNNLRESVTVNYDPIIKYKLSLHIHDESVFNNISCYGFDLSQKDLIGAHDYDKKQNDKGAIPVETIYRAALSNLVSIDVNSEAYLKFTFHRLSSKKMNIYNIEALAHQEIDKENNFSYYITQRVRVTKEFLEQIKV